MKNSFKPSKEHDYIQANIAYILRNAQWRNMTAKQTEYKLNERLMELGMQSVSIDVYFEYEIARSVFTKEMKNQTGEVAKEFKELTLLTNYSFQL